VCRVVATGLGLAVLFIASFVAVCFESRLNTGRVKRKMSRFNVFDAPNGAGGHAEPRRRRGQGKRGCLLWAFGRVVGLYMNVFYLLSIVCIYQVRFVWASA
jgi:hypothetical protein